MQSEWRPAELAGFVEQLWYSEGTISHPRERILPNGKIELIVNFGDPYRLVEGSGVERMSTGVVTGMQSRPIVIEGPRRHSVLGVRLHPAGAYALLATPMHEVSDLTVETRDLVGRAAEELAGRCSEAQSTEEKLRVVATWIGARIARARHVDPPVAWAANCIEKTDGGVSIRALRERTGFSKTRLASEFRDQIGFAPKRYSRIVRFRKLLAVLHGGAPSLADAALAAGYYDQPHMTDEFRELAGMTPREFLAMRYPGGVTAAEG